MSERQTKTTVRVANRPLALAGMDRTDPDADHPALTLWFFMGFAWGRLLWPLAIANALAWAYSWDGRAGKASWRSCRTSSACYG